MKAWLPNSLATFQKSTLESISISHPQIFFVLFSRKNLFHWRYTLLKNLGDKKFETLRCYVTNYISEHYTRMKFKTHNTYVILIDFLQYKQTWLAGSRFPQSFTNCLVNFKLVLWPFMLVDGVVSKYSTS